MTPATEKLFKELADDAGNWSGTPLLDISSAQRGNLTDLKKLGLVTTWRDEGCDWVNFTDAGKALAAEMGFEYFQD
jgi:hypothetical protein